MKFIGDVYTKWLQKPAKNHRQMELEYQFAFEDSFSKQWVAPAGTIVNGVSFPTWKKNKSFWWNISRTPGILVVRALYWTPFVGNARRASVLHDYYVDTQKESDSETHKMFYEAMLTDGVEEWKADIMYEAVKLFTQW